jgi:hypothetical protein
MRIRTPAIAALPLLLLTACDPGASAPPDAKPPAGQHGEAPAFDLPEGAVLGLDATATAGNGAVLDIQLVVRQPEPFSADGAADAWTATTQWCAGEVDDSVIADQGYTFTTIEVTATTREGDWPDDAPLLVLPLPLPDSTIATGGTLVQADGSTGPATGGDGVPHCRQPVLLPGPGTGQVYLGLPGDLDGDSDGTPPLGGWANPTAGEDANLPRDSPASAETFSECAAQVDLGAPPASWAQTFQADMCVVGGDAIGGDAG